MRWDISLLIHPRRVTCWCAKSLHSAAARTLLPALYRCCGQIFRVGFFPVPEAKTAPSYAGDFMRYLAEVTRKLEGDDTLRRVRVTQLPKISYCHVSVAVFFNIAHSKQYCSSLSAIARFTAGCVSSPRKRYSRCSFVHTCGGSAAR